MALVLHRLTELRTFKPPRIKGFEVQWATPVAEFSTLHRQELYGDTQNKIEVLSDQQLVADHLGVLLEARGKVRGPVLCSLPFSPPCVKLCAYP